MTGHNSGKNENIMTASSYIIVLESEMLTIKIVWFIKKPAERAQAEYIVKNT